MGQSGVINFQLKPWLSSHQDQLSTLKQRGLIVTDKAKALHYLQSLDYYRLSGYFYPFRQFDTSSSPCLRKDDFIANSQFDDVLQLYMFDKGLRILAFDALERIEMAVRTDIAHTLGKHHPNAHERSEFLDKRFCQGDNDKPSAHTQWLANYQKLVYRAKSQDFITHNLNTYGCLPIWAACEILDFGALSRLYGGMRYKDRQKISQKYSVTPEVFAQWLRSLNLVRNIVAHHSRLWSVKIINRSDFSKSFTGLAGTLDKNKAFGYFYLMAHFLGVISPNSTWYKRLITYIKTFPMPNNTAIHIADFGYLAEFDDLGQLCSTKKKTPDYVYAKNIGQDRGRITEDYNPSDK